MLIMTAPAVPIGVHPSAVDPESLSLHAEIAQPARRTILGSIALGNAGTPERVPQHRNRGRWYVAEPPFWKLQSEEAAKKATSQAELF